MYTYETDPNLRAMALAAAKSEKSTGYPPVVLLSQWAIESKWGQRLTGEFNYWGIKRYPDKGPAKLCPTWEDVSLAGFAAFRSDEKAAVTKKEPLGNGIWRFYMSCWFASYASVDESVAGYINFVLGNSRYHAAWSQYQLTHDTDSLLRGIARAGYADGKGYEDLLLTIEHQQNINHAVAMAAKEIGMGAAEVVS